MELSQDRRKELAETAKKVATPGKGVLAADESTGTILKRFQSINVENTEANRIAYRELLFRTKDLNQHISGAILYEETLFQKCPDGTPMTKLLQDANIVIGIKTDKGLVDLPHTDGEKATAGLDGLLQRSTDYYNAGARFCKWRAVLSIDQAKGKPSNISITETAYTLARYAGISQQAGLVPIVEPEILTDGSHTIEVCAEVTERVLAACVKALQDQKVMIEGCLLKPNMVTAGAECKAATSHDDIGFYTYRTLSRTMPPALPGVIFLSGGQSEEDASLNLNAINKIAQASGHSGWKLSFSYGRALQASVLKAWKGKAENVAEAQKTLQIRAKANGEASLGKYAGGTGSKDSLYVSKYVY